MISRTLQALSKGRSGIDRQEALRAAARARAAGLAGDQLEATALALLAQPDDPDALEALADYMNDHGTRAVTTGVLEHLLEHHPDHIGGRLRLADTLHRQGDTERALEWLAPTPGGDGPGQSHGQARVALLAASLHEARGARLPAAAACLAAVQARDAGEAECITAIARLLAWERGGDALAAVEQACQRLPGSAELADLRLHALLADGRPSEALAGVDAVDGTNAGRPGRRLARARALIDLGRPREALTACRQADKAGADGYDVAALRGLAHRLLGQARRALAAYDIAVRAGGCAARVRYGRAMALKALDLDTEALRALDALADETPGDTELAVERAALCQRLRRPDDAKAARRLAADLGPSSRSPCPEVPATLALDLEAGVAPGAWQVILDHGCLGEGERIGIEFALGHALEAAGEPRRAFACWRAANARVRARYAFDVAAMSRWMLSVPEASRPLIQRAPAVHREVRPAPQPIFIVGLPGSGTSLVEACLGRHDSVTPGGEQTILPGLLTSGEFLEGYPADLAQIDTTTLHDLREAYLSAARRVSPYTPWMTDKLGGNMVHLGLIHCLFPDSPIVYCRRDARDVIVSAYSQWFGEGHQYAYDLTDLATMTAAARDVMEKWQSLLPEDRVHDVAYGRLVTRFRPVIKDLLQACGLTEQEACYHPGAELRHIDTASARRVLSPITTRRIGRWRPHTADLSRLL